MEGLRVDGVLFTVKSRVQLGPYNALIVHVNANARLSGHVLYIRSNSWGGLFRLCLQYEGMSMLIKADNYTRGTFVKIELQGYFSRCYNRLPLSNKFETNHTLCAQAFKFFGKLQGRENNRLIQCPVGEPDYSTIERQFSYNYDFLIENPQIVMYEELDEYNALSPEKKRKFVSKVAYGADEATYDDKIEFSPTKCKVKGNVYRISIHGECPTFFYYAIVNLVTKVEKGDNPNPISSVDSANRFIPLITVPQTRQNTPVSVLYDFFGIYENYSLGPTKDIAKMLEYTQLCKKAHKRCSNVYVVNDEYVDNDFFTSIHRHTHRTTTKRYRPFVRGVRTYQRSSKQKTRKPKRKPHTG